MRSIYQNVELFIRSKTNIRNVAIFKYVWRNDAPKIPINSSYEKSDHFRQFVTRVYMMTQKGDPYTKLFSTLSEVILMSCILSQLCILYNNLIKPYFTKMTIHPLFTVYVL